MDVKVILLTGNLGESDCEGFAEVPFTLLEALGKPVLAYTIERLRRAGLATQDMCVLGNLRPAAAAYSQRVVERLGLSWTNYSGASLVRAAEGKFAEYAQKGAEVILVIQAGTYAEIDYEGFLQFHLESHNRVTCASDQEGLVGVFALLPSRRNDAAFLFRHNLELCRTTSIPFLTAGYVNRLHNAEDFRRLIQDSFAQMTEIRPVGRQTKPGVWAGAGARIERDARIVAPAYIGAGAKICKSAVVTRGSNVERNGFIDCGTILENTSVLPASYVGAGLDVANSVVGFRRIAHLKRKIEIEVRDRRLLAPVSAAAPWRLAGASAAAMELLLGGLRRPAKAPLEEPALLPEIVLEEETTEALSERELQQLAIDRNRSTIVR